MSDPKPPSRKIDRGLASRLRLEYANEPCQMCERRPGVHLHHVKFRSQGGDDARDNLRWLCIHCHEEAHGIRSIEH